VVLLVSLATTVISAIYVYTTTYQRNRQRFEYAVDETRDEIIARIDAYVGAMRGAAGLFAANEIVTRPQFRSYVERLDLQQRYPGAQGIGFSLRIPPDGEQAVVDELRASVKPALTAIERMQPDMEHHAIVMIEPVDERNLRAIGFDMFSEPIRRAAMQRARDTACAAATGKVTLIQEIEKNSQQAGFLIYVPVYRGGEIPADPENRQGSLVGFVYAPFRAGDLFHGITSQRRHVPVRIDVYDGAPPAKANQLYSTAADVGYPVSFTSARNIDVAGRNWTIQFATMPLFDTESGRNLTPFVLVLGSGVSLILFVLTRSQVRARRAAERLAMEVQLADRALRYSESRFRRLAESNLIGVVFSDIFGAVADGNDAYFHLIGFTREEALAGKVRWDLITPPEWVDADRRAMEDLLSRGVAEPFEKEYVRKDGTRVPVLVGVALLEGSTTETVAFVVDLTERYRTERDLVRAMQTAEAANHAKDQFLAVLSHELRTPLSPVLALAASAQNDPALSEELRSDFAMIRRNIELEAKLIDDLLDLTKIGRGKLQLHLETVDLHHTIENAVHVCSNEDMQMKRLSVSVNLAAGKHHVRGDPARLQQVFWNLLKNAVKFTLAGGKISVTSSNDASGRVRVSVADTGIGIEPQVLPRIFDAFEQGEVATTRNFGGLGLGLAISRGLVEAHGGTIAAASSGRNRGSTFTIALDTVAAQRPAAAPASPRDGRRGAGRVSILLVEDHIDTAMALKRLLQHFGYEVRSADSIESALNIAAQTDFDVVVSDLGLPDGSGLDLIRELRAKKPIKGIALTGFGMEEDVTRSMEAGFSEHLTKPVNFQTLCSAIERVTTRPA
jgi:PAS domain S-box-containing protein